MTCPSSSFDLDDVIELEGGEFNEDIRNKDVAEEAVNQNPNDGDEKSKEQESKDVKEVKMHMHLLSQDEEYVDCIEKGPHVPMRVATGNEAFIPKPRADWSDPDIEQVHKDKKAMNILFNGVYGDMFNNIINYKTAKDV
ncbi:hypothetical protein AgCh_038251 [Apium graveolens]